MNNSTLTHCVKFTLLSFKDVKIVKVLWNASPQSHTVSLYRMCVMGKIQHWKKVGWRSLLQQAYLSGHNYRIIIHNGNLFLKHENSCLSYKILNWWQITRKLFLTMNQNDQFPTRAMPCLKNIVLIKVLPLTTWSHFPFPDNILSFCLSLLKSCLLSLTLSLLHSASEISKSLLTHIGCCGNAINHHSRHLAN